MNESSLTAPRPEAPAPEAGPRYNFAAAEPKWQQAWAERGCFRVEDVPKDGKAKYYVLEITHFWGLLQFWTKKSAARDHQFLALNACQPRF